MDDYFFYLKKIDALDTNKKTDKPKKINKKLKISGSNSMDINANSNTYEITSEEQSSNSSFFMNCINDAIESKNNIQKNKINELKLNYIRKYMKTSNMEVIDGESFEKYVKRIFRIMLVIIKIDYYNFLNPKEVRYTDLLDISEIPSGEIKKKNFEIDLIINGFKQRDLILLLERYPKHFFFREQLGDILNGPEQKFNFISEICSNLIMKIEDKNSQVEKYINILKAFDIFRSKKLLALSDIHKKIIIDSTMIEPYNQNIFVFITNGSYFLLKFVVQIVSSIFDKEKATQKSLTDSQIKEIIEKEIKNETIEKSPIIYNLIKNEDNLGENIFLFFKTFNKLRINKIKHCVFYIGEESGTFYEDNIVKFAKIKQNELIYDDIYIMYKIKNLIKELYKLNDNFIKTLNDFYTNIIINLSKENEKIKKLLGPFQFSREDLIKMKIILNKKDEEAAKVIIKQDYFIYDVEYANDEEINNYINQIERIEFPMIMFISDNDNLNLNFLELVNKTDRNKTRLYFYETNRNFINTIKSVKSQIPKDFIKRYYYKKNPKIPKFSFEMEGILNYQKLSSKIEKELGISINENQIKESISLNLTNEEKNTHFDNIEKNIIAVNTLIGLSKCEENISNLKKKYESRMILLEENIKASAFYDFLYFVLIPELKYQDALKIYS